MGGGRYLDWDGVCAGGDCALCAVEEYLMGWGGAGVGWGSCLLIMGPSLWMGIMDYEERPRRGSPYVLAAFGDTRAPAIKDPGSPDQVVLESLLNFFHIVGPALRLSPIRQ